MQHVDPKAVEEYNALLAAQPHKEKRLNWEKEKEVSKQTRWNVSKSMWYMKDALQHQIQVRGSRSELGIYLVKSETRIIETLYNVKGVMQQELYYTLDNGVELVFVDEGKYRKRSQSDAEYMLLEEGKVHPWQRCKYFEAAKAVCDFHANTIIFYDATFWTYTVAGHAIVLEPKNLSPQSMGKARMMTLRLRDNKTADFTASAEGVSVQLLDGKGL